MQKNGYNGIDTKIGLLNKIRALYIQHLTKRSTGSCQAGHEFPVRAALAGEKTWSRQLQLAKSLGRK